MDRMAVVRTPRTRWIDEGLKALASGGGPEAVRVEPLAQTLGVTKGGFYWHFTDRGALLDEMVDGGGGGGIEGVIGRVEGGGGAAGDKLRGLFSLASSGRGLLKIALAVRDWARRDKAV